MAILSYVNATLDQPETAPATNNHDGKLLYDIRTAANKISCSVPTVRKLIRQRRLQRVPNIHKVLIPITELQKFVNTATA
jgi:hypothetical protein